MDLLRVDITGNDGIALHGELDAASAHLLEDLIERIPRDGDPVIIDLSDLSFIDASGVRSLAAVASADPGRRVVAASTRPNVAGVLSLLTDVLPPNLSVEPGPTPGARTPSRSRSAAGLSVARWRDGFGARIRSQIGRGRRRFRRLRRRIARMLAASRRLASDATRSR